MYDENEMSQLKDLYEELWADAKTLIQDMAGGIAVYRFSSFLLFIMNFFPIFSIITSVISILRGNIGFWELYNLIVPSVAVVFFTYLGLKFRNVYSRLKDRYAKLLKMKSELED